MLFVANDESSGVVGRAFSAQPTKKELLLSIGGGAWCICGKRFSVPKGLKSDQTKKINFVLDGNSSVEDVFCRFDRAASVFCLVSLPIFACTLAPHL